jgi:plasmid stabilization system protein ParE
VRELPVWFAPEARTQLAEIYRYIAAAASPGVAQNYTDQILDFCEGLGAFPLRGVARDNIRESIRIVVFRRRVTIAYSVERGRVEILGVFYGGREIRL